MTIDQLLEQFDEALRDKLRPYVRATVTLTPDPDADVAPLSSYIGGYPYCPDEWPTIDDVPATFLAQVNLAEFEVPDGFPTSGLLQWFVGRDDTYGLEWNDGDTGREGLVVRYWSADQLDADSPDPDAEPPYDDEDEDETPVLDADPVALVGAVAFALPGESDEHEEGWEDLLDEIRDNPDDYGIDDVDDFLDGLRDLVTGHRIGGYPAFVQADPRGGHPDQPGRLLLQLDSDEHLMFGDTGSAQLFGDPAALRRGDVSGIWWDWACG